MQSEQIKNAVKDFQLSCSREALVQFLNLCPFKISIFREDGTSVFVNQLICEELDVDASAIVGVYNFLKDPIFGDMPEIIEFARKSFSGQNEKVSLRILLDDINDHLPNKHFKGIIYLDLTSFTVVDEKKDLKYIVITYITRKIYEGSKAITKAQEYINANWLDNFSLEIIAKEAGLTVRNFSRIFRSETGKTPYEYYKNLKIEKLKERLSDPGLNVTDAFLDCGLDYYSQYRQYFKESVGMTPRDYSLKYSKFR